MIQKLKKPVQITESKFLGINPLLEWTVAHASRSSGDKLSNAPKRNTVNALFKVAASISIKHFFLRLIFESDLY